MGSDRVNVNGKALKTSTKWVPVVVKGTIVVEDDGTVKEYRRPEPEPKPVRA